MDRGEAENPTLSRWTSGWESQRRRPGSVGAGCQGGREACSTSLCSSPDTFWKNPQFLLSVWSPQEGRRFPMPCSVLVSLLQKPRHRHRNWKPHLAIGFYLFRVGGPRGIWPPGASPTIGHPFFLFPDFLPIRLYLHMDLGAGLSSVPWNMSSGTSYLRVLEPQLPHP